MNTILFQGDSITDAGRDRTDWNSLGYGYPLFAGCRIALEHPNEYQCLNRGVSGDRVVDIYARMKVDIVNIKPDVLTVLVGINDVWHELINGNGVSVEKYRRIYRMLLEELREALPATKIILLEPFVLKGSATAEHLQYFKEEVAKRAAVVRELAQEFNLIFVPLQEDLNRIEKLAPEGYWLFDGVHPTGAFHQYLADKLLRIIFQDEQELYCMDM